MAPMGDAAGRAPRLSFYVQHLLGIGHLARAFRVTHALRAAGWDAEVLVGGELPPGFPTGDIPLVGLPPVRAAAGGLATLVHPDGGPFDAAAQAQRREHLLAHIAARRPDVLMIEAFPFGRRQMRFELIPLLETVAASTEPPLIVSSVRDILQANRRPERVAETVALVHRFFDHVLVHGDPTLLRLEDSFPAATSFAGKLLYTGLVAPPVPALPMQTASRHDVVVSVGGGAVGAALLGAALAARPLSQAADARWLVLTGPNLAIDAPPPDLRLTLTRFVPDLAAILAGARLSVSQAGYNTVADVLVAGVRAVLVPYAQDGETEQSLRAAYLAQAGRATVVSEAGLDPASLAAAIDAALTAEPAALAVDLGGADRTATMLRDLLDRHRKRI